MVATVLQRIGAHRDLALAGGVVAIIAMLILPMPGWLLDLGLALSITLSVMILMTALFIEKPLQLSAFPTILLISTMLRLGLNLASTRLILSHGHEGAHAAGGVIAAFGEFLIGGETVIGLTIFAMLLWLISNPDKQRLKGLAEYFSPSSAAAAEAGEAASSLSGIPGMPGAGGHTRRNQAENARAVTGQPSMAAATAGVATGGTASVPDAALRVLAQEMKVSIDSLASEDGAAARIEEDRDGLRISLMDTDRRPMFRDGTAELNGYARAMLARVAAKLARSDAPVAIEGHTDGRGGADAAWRLSGARALAARSAMIAAGLPGGRFAEVVALADTRPVYPDQPDRPENRRITIVAKGAAPVLPSDASFRF